MKLHVINNEKKKLQCVFNTLVIKNESLERSYKAGLIGFLDKHGGECNGNITVVCYMGGDIYDTMDELVENGLKFLDDFEFIDAGSYVIFDPNKEVYPHYVSQRVDWLKGRYANGYIYVWYADDKQAEDGC